MKKIAIQLEQRDGADIPDHEPERAYVLLDHDGSVLAVAGPDVNCTIGASRCKAAIEDLGYSAQEFEVGPVIPVSRETMDMFVSTWGRDSRTALLREARRVYARNGLCLSTEATTERFERAADRELAAALWILWLDGERTGAALDNCTPDAGFCCDEACQIGSFVMYLDGDGRVRFAEFPTVGAAAKRVSEIDVQWRRGIGTLQEFLDAHGLGAGAR